jgi:hypothetical protein
LLDELTKTLRKGKRTDRDEAEWLDGVRDEGLLPLLFDALTVALRIDDDSPFGVSGVIGRAIYRIGGEEAVHMYDELIASSDESRFRFLRLQRDEIVQAELRTAGQTRAADVASRLQLVSLEPEAATSSEYVILTGRKTTARHLPRRFLADEYPDFVEHVMQHLGAAPR